MAGALTLSGMAAGLMSGSKVVGPSTMTGAVIVGGISVTSVPYPFLSPVIAVREPAR